MAWTNSPWQIAALFTATFILILLWRRGSVAKGKLPRAGELYLWLVFVMAGVFASVNYALGMKSAVGVALFHLLLILGAFRVQRRSARENVSPRVPANLARLAAELLILGSAVFALGAAVWPGPGLRAIAEHRAEHVFTSVAFLLGTLLTLSGVTVLRTVLRQTGESVFSELGLVGFLFGAVCWSVHLAHRIAVTLPAAQQWTSSGNVPPWYDPVRAWAGLMYGLYMFLGYLAISLFGAGLQNSRFLGQTGGRFFKITGVTAAAGLVAGVGVFNPPVLLQLFFYLIGMIVFRRAAAIGKEAQSIA